MDDNRVLSTSIEIALPRIPLIFKFIFIYLPMGYEWNIHKQHQVVIFKSLGYVLFLMQEFGIN